MKLSTKLPGDLRQQILDAKADVERQLAASKDARKAADSQITALEHSAEEVARRIDALKQASIKSEAAAGQLVIAERRATSIDLELKTLKAAREAAPGVEIFEALALLRAISLWYREAVKTDLLAAVAPFDYPEHLALPLLAHSGAIAACNIIRDWTGMGPKADMGTITRLFKYFDRALAGNVCLHRDTSDGESAPADTSTPE